MPPAPTQLLDRDALQRVLAPVLVAHGLALVEVTFQREPQGWVLRVTVENPSGAEPGDGVTLDKCAELSRDLSHALDAEDVISHAFSLEVGSPGVERPLRSLADFARFVGKGAKVKTRQPLPDGQRALRGVIDGVEGDVVTMVADGRRHAFSVGDVASAHLTFDFGPAPKPGKGKAAGAQKSNKQG
ncbi:MAG: ribosome maturation factor RimP [Polyangiaceae bacterium]|nr:ribosome maturation factor RimP [Polyangiaceae bacterium]